MMMRLEEEADSRISDSPKILTSSSSISTFGSVSVIKSSMIKKSDDDDKMYWFGCDERGKGLPFTSQSEEIECLIRRVLYISMLTITDVLA